MVLLGPSVWQGLVGALLFTKNLACLFLRQMSDIAIVCFEMMRNMMQYLILIYDFFQTCLDHLLYSTLSVKQRTV